MATAVPVTISAPSGVARALGGKFPSGSSGALSGGATLGDVSAGGSFTGYSAPSVATGVYRSTQPYLFQPVDAAARASRIVGGADYLPDIWGPTKEYVDFSSGWPWDNLGGDYVAGDLSPQGSTPWASVDTPQGTAGVIYDFTMNVTTALQYIQTNGLHCALLVTQSTAPRKIATPFHPTPGKAPRIDVTYVGGATAVLACRVAAFANSGTPPPITASPDIPLPGFLEFDKPIAAVASATLRFSCTETQWSGSPRDIKVAGVMRPPKNVEAPTGGDGLVAQAAALDSGLSVVPGIKGVHRYLDGANINDFLVVDPTKSTGSEQYYSQEFWGGSVDTGKWPHTVAGKWLQAATFQAVTTPQLVDSSYTGEGFVPLAAGVGALKFVMPAQSVVDGQEVTNAGRLAANLSLMLGASDFGVLQTLFVRYYVRVGTPYAPTPADRKHVLSGGAPRWTDLSGKFNIGFSHETTGGGVSGSSGGGYGWLLRPTFMDVDQEEGGPAEGGQVLGWEMYDFQTNNPVGHRYGVEQNAQFGRWGQRGGVGAELYAGRWVCIEQQLKLNTVTAPSTWSADGELRCWIDGVLAFERTGMVFRTLPRVDPGYNASQLRAALLLGHRELRLNWFHGGQTENNIPRTMFLTGLAWGTSRIGPMKMPSAPAIQLSGTQYTPRRDDRGFVLESDIAQLPIANKWYEVMPVTGYPSRISQTQYGPDLRKPNGSPDYDSTTDWSGAIFVPSRQWIIGGGAGHNGSSGAQITLNGIDCPKLMARNWSPPNSDTNVLVHVIPGDHASALKFVNPVWSGEEFCPNYSNPCYDPRDPHRGTVGATHTYWGPEWIPPALAKTSGLPDADLGGFYWRGTASALFNISDMENASPGDYVRHTKVWWRRLGGTGVIADSYVVSMLIENVIYMTYQSAAYVQRYQVDATEITDWQTAVNPATGLLYDPNPAVPSQMKQLLDVTLATGTKLIPYALQVPCKMYGRGAGGELAMISGSGNSKRFRWGALHAAIKAGTFTGATSIDPYIDDITLTSGDGSHTELNNPLLYRLFQDAGGQQPWDGAGSVYEAGEDAIYLYPSAAGFRVIKITGLSGSTWTTQYVANSELPVDMINGIFGRAQHFKIGNTKLAIWAAFYHTYVARLA